ncbi:MAG TPA: SMP-30/gluconolactonase/LRE family protein [Allosphingosinicella sp.]|uniref:SMP-30/gluconolactonase/LRE family protein n=1 Tax=Allosphingosinicella sp. TaxID=2823234 RepID=UPI002ED928BF
MTEDKTPRCVANVKAVLGEGPIWVEREQALYWVDIKGRKIFRLREGDKLDQWDTPMGIGSIAPRANGGFIAGTDQGFAEIDPERGVFDVRGTPEESRPDNRFNDGKVDRSGRFWAGTMDDTEQQASGALYRLDPTGRWTRLDDGYRVTNGPAFSPGGKLMYHADSARQVIYVFDVDEDGEISERNTFARFEEKDGYPDGMTVDAEGHLWVAFWDGWCVRRFSPAGECVQVIDLPVQRPTSVAFGGPALDRLYITSASIGLDDLARGMQPYAGGLFMTVPGVTGVAEIPFAG